MREYKMKVNFQDGSIESDFMELVENDYNSTTLDFTFDIDERIVLKILYPDKTIAYVNDIVDNKFTFGPGLLVQNGTYQMELSAYDGSGRLTNYATTSFYVRPELVNTDEVVEPDDRVPILDNLINEVENLDLDATKSDDIATITIEKKDGTVKTVEIRDGIDGIDGVGLNYNWVATSLGIKREDEQNYQYVNLKGDKGDAGAIKMVIVNELPASGSDDTIYLVPLENPDISGNNYAEYVWINNAWELLGKIGVQVDLTDYYTKQETNTQISTALTDYVKNTDYATFSKGGVVKANNTYKFIVNDSGLPYADIVTYSNYANTYNYAFISKGTLENVIRGKGLTTKAYVDGLVGDIGTALDLINGESVGD